MNWEGEKQASKACRGLHLRTQREKETEEEGGETRSMLHSRVGLGLGCSVQRYYMLFLR